MAAAVPDPPRSAFARRTNAVIEGFILFSRYLLVPLYCALVFVIFKIGYDFFMVLIGSDEESRLVAHTIQALELLDITMIANLIWLISAGSYYVFVDNYYPRTSGMRRPRSLVHISSGVLKEKMAGSLIGVSSVHLLQTFLNISTSHEAADVTKVCVLVGIHLVFIFGLLAFNYSNASDHHNNHPEEKEGGQTPEAHP